MSCPICSEALTTTEVFVMADKDTDESLCRHHLFIISELLREEAC